MTGPFARSPRATVDTYLAALTEVDAVERDTMIADVWSPGGTLIDHPRTVKGHTALSRMAVITQIEYPGYSFRRLGDLDHHDWVLQFAWEFVNPDLDATIRGVDEAVLAVDGRLQRVTRRYHVQRPASTNFPQGVRRETLVRFWEIERRCAKIAYGDCFDGDA